VPECQKIKKGGLDQYGAEHFVRLIFATNRKNVGVKGLRAWMKNYSVVESNYVFLQELLTR